MISFVVNNLPNKLESRLKQDELSKEKRIALANLMDLGLAFGANHFVLNKYNFGPLNWSLLSVAMTQCANTAVVVCVVSKVLWNYKEKPTIWHSINESLSGTCRTIPQFSLMLLANMSYPYYGIHEYGHFLSALAFFEQKKYPRVRIKPFYSGSTSYAISHGLTFIGNQLGKANSLTLVQASGLGASTIFAMTEFGISSLLKKSFPNLSHLMDLQGKTQLFHEILYGFSAFIGPRHDREHDLKAIWLNTGITPIIPLGITIGITLIQKCCLEGLHRRIYNNISNANCCHSTNKYRRSSNYKTENDANKN
jgi:hypothetical protein